MTVPWSAHLPAGVRAEQVDLLADRSLPGSWLGHWVRDPGRPLVRDEVGGWLTAGALEERSRAVAGRFAVAGLEPGDRILMSAGASSALVVAHVAALRLGLVVVPVNPAYVEREVAHVVRDASPKAALVDDAIRGRWVEVASAHKVVIAGPEVALPGGEHAPSLDGVTAADPAMLLYTSGTTGVPKGAVLTHGNLLAGAQSVRLAWRWTPDDRLLLALPLFHLHGLGVGLHGTLTAGASVVLRPRFDPGDVLDGVARHAATLFFGVPTMYARLASTGRLGAMAALRLCVSGSAPLPPDLHAAVATGAGQRIVERYGMTETMMNASNPYEGERRPGSVGLPLPGVEIRLEGGTDEILLRGPNVFAGYWNRPEATAAAFTEGWFRSGDVGALDSDGYLRIVGRRTELIICGGYNVYPREIEDVLRGHPGVIDVAVVGAPHPDLGEQVVAVVVGDVTPAVLLAHASARLAPYKRPREVRIVDRLPRNAMGKVQRDRLLDTDGRQSR